MKKAIRKAIEKNHSFLFYFVGRKEKIFQFIMRERPSCTHPSHRLLLLACKPDRRGTLAGQNQPTSHSRSARTRTHLAAFPCSWCPEVTRLSSLP